MDIKEWAGWKLWQAHTVLISGLCGGILGALLVWGAYELPSEAPLEESKK